MNPNNKTDEELFEQANAAVGTKLDPNKSRFAKPEPVDKPNLEDAAAKDQASKQEAMSRAIDLSRRFVKIIEDKTLPENKGPAQDSAEKETINDLIEFAIAMNNDHAQKEGIGSVGLITLIFNCLLKIRNRCNKIEFAQATQEKQLKELYGKLKELEISKT